MPRFPEPVSISILKRAAAEKHAQVVRLALDRFTYSELDLDNALRGAADLPANLLDGPARGAFPSLEYLHQQQVIGLLIDAGADPNRCRHIVNKAATYIDLVGALKTLLERGADPNERRGDQGATALHRLGSPVYVGRGPARYCHETGIRILLDHGARVLERDTEGNTALHYAAFGSNLQIFRLLVSKLPPDMDASIISLKNNSGEALLHWAAAGKKYDVVQYLLSAGADVNCANDNGWTPLLCAVAPSKAIYQLYDMAETATLLLEQGADPLVCSTEAWTPLLCVAAHLDTEEDSLLAKVAADLVARGATIAQRAVMLSVSAHYGRHSARPDTLDIGLWGSRLASYLLTASQEGSGAVVVNDTTPLHWAALYGAVGTAAVLKAHGADTQAKDANADSAIQLTFAGSPLRALAERVDRVHDNVLFITLIRPKFIECISIGLRLLPGFLLRPLQRQLPPQYYLPGRLVLKTRKPGWDDEFVNEKAMYKRVEPLQGRIIPRFLGDAEFNNTPSIVLSRFEGVPSNKQGLNALPAEDFKRQLEPILRAFTDYGVIYDDPKLDNFIVVKGKVKVVDLESILDKSI
ncbi:ankyrin domain [Cordyceps militaris]|uniref:Ankyrin domain n=1 Tax=Cordyceps militaris TaxID=73501 RepID=A0A2H4SAN4_CORMI|nr:ankyrin domain [Cordyceps militaris]